jgi:hypothetical protein
MEKTKKHLELIRVLDSSNAYWEILAWLAMSRIWQEPEGIEIPHADRLLTYMPSVSHSAFDPSFGGSWSPVGGDGKSPRGGIYSIDCHIYLIWASISNSQIIKTFTNQSNFLFKKVNAFSSESDDTICREGFVPLACYWPRAVLEIPSHIYPLRKGRKDQMCQRTSNFALASCTGKT